MLRDPDRVLFSGLLCGSRWIPGSSINISDKFVLFIFCNFKLQSGLPVVNYIIKQLHQENCCRTYLSIISLGLIFELFKIQSRIWIRNKGCVSFHLSGKNDSQKLRTAEPQRRQSVKLFLQSQELGLPQPLTHGRVCPTPLLPGEGERSLAREGVGESQFRHTLFVYIYFVSRTITECTIMKIAYSVHCLNKRLLFVIFSICKLLKLYVVTLSQKICSLYHA